MSGITHWSVAAWPRSAASWAFSSTLRSTFSACTSLMAGSGILVWSMALVTVPSKAEDDIGSRGMARKRRGSDEVHIRRRRTWQQQRTFRLSNAGCLPSSCFSRFQHGGDCAFGVPVNYGAPSWGEVSLPLWRRSQMLLHPVH